MSNEAEATVQKRRRTRAEIAQIVARFAYSGLTRTEFCRRLELSNNLAENSMRPIAVGRKNWIHVGSAQAGPKVAAILSIVETCRRLKLPVREYLASVLPGLANRSLQRTVELTPMVWTAKQTQLA